MECQGAFRRGITSIGIAGWAAIVMLAMQIEARASDASQRWNILWITAEDICPDLGCYGDAEARTPNLDRFAAQGARFTNCFSVAGVCAPSRSAIITGMYPTTIGTHHMRSKGVPPAYVKCFPEYLRATGYYCTNNAKTDYNFDPPVTAWDANGNRAHWRGRAKGQPFFAVFNINTSHEGKIRSSAEEFARLTRRLRPEDRHDPARAKLPPYYPDTPVVRNDWARYYDLVSAMDLEFADLLRQLEEDGLADRTIVFFYGDNGRGLPRAKRWLYDSGMHVPLIVRWPGTLKPATVREELVSFIDLAPTVLSLAGVKVPAYMQGQAFLGERAAKPRTYVFGARDRMDETYDLIRAVRDVRYKYILNLQPDKPYTQHIAYMDLMPTMKELRRLDAAGELSGPPAQFFRKSKPREELFDTLEDPHEIRDLAADPQHAATLKRLRSVLDTWRRETHDLGDIPEPQLLERMRPGGAWSTTEVPVIDPPGGTVSSAARVEITCPTSGASIAWTTDEGRSPRWQLYVGPIPVPTGKTLRAKACRLGFRDSEEVKAIFHTSK